MNASTASTGLGSEEILGASAQTRKGAVLYEDTISLLWPDGRQLLVHENGGEFNATVREPDGRVWEPDFSVAYTMWSGRIDHDTMAYRILCLLGGRQIVYDIDLNRWPTHRGAAVALRVVADYADLAAKNLTQVDVPVLLADLRRRSWRSTDPLPGRLPVVHGAGGDRHPRRGGVRGGEARARDRAQGDRRCRGGRARPLRGLPQGGV